MTTEATAVIDTEKPETTVHNGSNSTARVTAKTPSGSTTGRAVLGLDIGAHSMKIVCVRVGTKFDITHSGVFELPEDSEARDKAIRGGLLDFIGALKQKPKILNIISSGPGNATVCSSFPVMDEAELAQAIRWKVLAESSVAEDAVTGFCITRRDTSAKSIEAVAAAAPDDLGILERLFGNSYPSITSVITQPFAAENLVRQAFPGSDAAPTAVLDVGKAGSILSVIGPGGVEFTRLIPIGGDSFTAALVGSMNVGMSAVEIKKDAAEEIKRKFRINQTEPVQMGDVQVPSARVMAALRPVLEKFGSEIVRSIQYYGQSHAMSKVQRLFISGGGATFGGLSEYLCNEARIITLPLDPWRLLGVQTPPPAPPVLFANAVGAAIHQREGINLVSNRIKRLRLFGLLKKVTLCVGAVVILALWGAAWTANTQLRSFEKALAQKKTSLAALEKISTRIGDVENVRADIAQRQSLLSALGIGRPMHAVVLKELSNIMPDGTYLKSIEFTKTTDAVRMDLQVEIFGMPGASASQLKQQFMYQLETSPFFANASFSPARNNGQAPADAASTPLPDEEIRLTCQVLGFPWSGK